MSIALVFAGADLIPPSSKPSALGHKLAGKWFSKAPQLERGGAGLLALVSSFLVQSLWLP